MDLDGYDQLVENLSLVDPWEREYRRPSDFPSAREFVAAMTSPNVTGSLSPVTPADVDPRGVDERAPGNPPATPPRPLSSGGAATGSPVETSTRPASTPDGS